VTLDDPEVSRRHAVVRSADGGLEITDLGSLNGTFVNDGRIEGPRRLARGDLVRVGQTSYRIDVPASPLQPPVLVVRDGPSAGRRFPVEAAFSLGRENADVTLDDPEMSRRHAVVRPVDGTFQIADAGSLNGTFVNGARIDDVTVLADGDLVRLGLTSFHVEVPSAPASRADAATVVSRGQQ
jgi:pSer/pThr/pTyr-binding forkhead associated (FHA) protein